MRFLLSLLFLLPLILVSAPPVSDVTLPRCTDAQHASYTTTGPDGQRYPTWHPQIDPYYGCYYSHEHGSNPALFLPGVWWQPNSGRWPAFGYSANLMGMTEGHPGFKVYVVREHGKRLLILQHQGTANAPLAACARHHTLDITIYDEASGAIDLDYHGMADFGPSVENTTGTPLAPPACPDQGSVQSTGVRQLPVGAGSVGYEPWRTDVVTSALNTRLTFNTLNPQTGCDALACASAVLRSDIGGPARGTMRSLSIEWLHFGSWDFPQAACYPYGTDMLYDCTERAHDEAPYRLDPFVTGAN